MWTTVITVIITFRQPKWLHHGGVCVRVKRWYYITSTSKKRKHIWSSRAQLLIDCDDFRVTPIQLQLVVGTRRRMIDCVLVLSGVDSARGKLPRACCSSVRCVDLCLTGTARYDDVFNYCWGTKHSVSPVPHSSITVADYAILGLDEHRHARFSDVRGSYFIQREPYKSSVKTRSVTAFIRKHHCESNW